MDERITDEEYTLLLLSGLFDDEEIELLMLADAIEHAESAPVHTKFKRFDLSRFTDEECRHNFRFSRTDLVALTTLLHMPPKYRSPNRVTWGPLEELCAVLRRLAYPNRLADLMPMFGQSVSQLCDIIRVTGRDLCERYAYLVSRVNHESGMRNSHMLYSKKGLH